MSTLLICGSRDLTNYQLVVDAIRDSNFIFDEIIEGGCRGVDYLGRLYADGHDIHRRCFPANWDKHGISAGLRRNSEMVEQADMVIAITLPTSRGTWDTIRKAQYKGIPVHIVEVSK